jgi:hypothetical protein
LGSKPNPHPASPLKGEEFKKLKNQWEIQKRKSLPLSGGDLEGGNFVKKRCNMSEIKIYTSVLKDIKNRIQKAQAKAVLSANAEMIMMYFDIGKMIYKKQQKMDGEQE